MTALPRMSAIVLLTAAAPALSQVVTFEGSSFPDEQVWTRSTFCTPERTIEDGLLHQHLEPAQCAEPPSGDRDTYVRSLAEFIGVSDFFVEWRMRADGDASEITWGGPSAVAPGSQGPVRYLFFIARDLVKFNRDNNLPIIFVEIDPDVLHTHRLELHGEQLYAWYIDGVLVDSGVPEGAYPSNNPSITWSVKSAFLESYVTWDFLRYGAIPANEGDFNSDGEIDSYDLYFFQECFLGPGGSWPGCAWADMDGSGTVNCDDWMLFLAAWTDPADPPGMPECAVPPDFDGNGHVGAFDLAILLGSWGPCPDPPTDCPPDLDGDAQVGASDLAMLLGSWG